MIIRVDKEVRSPRVNTYFVDHLQIDNSTVYIIYYTTVYINLLLKAEIIH